MKPVKPVKPPNEIPNSQKRELLGRLYAHLNQLVGIEQRLTIFEETTEMALDQKIVDVLAAIDVATNEIAARIQRLIDAATAGGVSVDEVVAALQPEVDKLTAMGKDPVV